MNSIAIDRTDGLASSVAVKGPCRVATTANISLSGLQTVDGVSLAAGDRVLVKDQTSASENGIYVVDTGPWRRAKDFNKTRDVVKGTLVLVTDGTIQAGWVFEVESSNPVVVGTSSISFTVSMPAFAGAVFETEADFESARIPAPVMVVETAGYYAIGDGGGHVKKRISTPSPVQDWQNQSADGAWWETVWNGSIDLLKYGLRGDGSDESELFSSALVATEFLGFGKIICTNATKQFKLVEVQISDDIEINLGGATILGDFGAWGTHSTLGTPIYWTKNVFFSEAADAPSVTLSNLTLNGQSDHAFAMAGGTPIIDFRGAAAAGDCIIRFENFTMTRGANRRYTAGSGISAPTLLLDYRNMEVLVYNADEVWLDNCQFRSSPGEMLQIQADDQRTKGRIERSYFTKSRDTSPSTKWSSSALNIFNCHPSFMMRSCRFWFFTKGPVNWESDGALIENCEFDYVDDSNGIDFCEARSFRFNQLIVRGCYFKDIVNVGIRSSGSNTLFENNTFEKVNICVSYEGGVVGDPARGTWLKTNQVILANNVARNLWVKDFDAAHAQKYVVQILGASTSLPISVLIEGGSLVDGVTTNRPVYNVYASNANLSLRGYFGSGTTALVYMTGTCTLSARDCTFAPEAGQGVHTFQFESLTAGKKALVLENCTRTTTLDGGQYDFRTDSVTFDVDALHVNRSPGLAGTTNNAVVHRDGLISGSATYDPASIAAGASVSTTVTVTGARLAVGDMVQVAPSISTGGLIVSGYISSNNTVTVVYFNPTAGAIDMASHTIFAYVRKAPA